MSECTSPGNAKPILAQFEELAQKRRAIGHFLRQPLERELIERLLRTAQWALSGYNLQPTRFVVVVDLDPLAHQTGMHESTAPREAPTVIVFGCPCSASCCGLWKRTNRFSSIIVNAKI